MKAHVVPRTYLKGFANSKGSAKGLAVYDVTLPLESQIARPNITDVKTASTIDDFYILRKQSGDDAFIEQGLSEIEQRWTTVRKALRGGSPLTNDVWRSLLLFAAAQEARTLRTRRVLARPLPELLNFIERESRARHLSEAEIQSWKGECIRRHRDAETDGLDSSPSNISLAALPVFIRQNAAIFGHMKRMLLRSTGPAFVTSDHPVIWLDPLRWDKTNPCPNKLSISAEVTFPLDKQHCLVMGYLPMTELVAADEEVVASVNARTASYALTHVYATPISSHAEADFHCQFLINPALSTRPLVSEHFNPLGTRTNTRALLAATGASLNAFLSGNSHIAPREHLVAMAG